MYSTVYIQYALFYYYQLLYGYIGIYIEVGDVTAIYARIAGIDTVEKKREP
jgi:hypothetical protein